MRTGFSKKQKTTSIFFDEASPIIEVCTYNTSLKNRLSEYSEKYPAECRLVDDDENGCLTFEIRKGRFSFKLNAPYSAERRKGGQRAGKEEYPELTARQEVIAHRPWGECFPAGGVFVLLLMFL